MHMSIPQFARLSRRLFLLVSIFNLYLFSASSLHAQSLIYANVLNNSYPLGGDVYNKGITTDAAGNIYITGYYAGIADFDPGSGVVNQRTTGNYTTFVAKYDAAGNYIFAKSLQGSYNSSGNSIYVDAAGYIYITGYFSYTTDFDPGTGTANITSNANTVDIFIAKYDAAGNYIYAKALSGPSTEEGLGIAADNAGNVYITGYFSGTVDFDPGAGTSNLSSIATNRDIFVAKYDVNGNYVYANAFGDYNTDYGNGIAVDAAGNAYITGYFLGTVDFDPGAGTASLTGAGSFDIFFAKYDPNGNYLFAKALRGSSNEQGNAIALDASSNIYLTGLFSGTTDFDPDAGVVNVNSSMGSNDVFLAKYDAAGNYIYAKAMGGTGNDYGQSIAVDASGNTYISGIFNSTADFDPSAATANLSSAGSTDAFMAMYNASGGYVYAKKVGGISSEFGYGITVDVFGNVITAGAFSGTGGDFDPDAGTVTFSVGNTAINAFLVKLDNTGAFSFAGQLGTYSNLGLSDQGRSIATDAAGNAYVTGNFAGTVDFDPGTGVANLTATGSFNIFFAKYDANGNYVFAKQITGGDCYRIRVDASGNIYIIGYFSGTVDFDPGAGVSNLTSNGGIDVFFAKYDAAGNYVLAKNVGGSSSDQIYGMTIDGSGNIYITGAIVGTADLDPGPGYAGFTSNSSTSDIFFAKYDASGNYVFAKAMGGNGVDIGYGIAVDAAGKIYITGVIYSTVDFDPGAGTANLVAIGSGEAFLASYDALGNYTYAKLLGAGGTDIGKSIQVDASGYVYITGSFSATVDFDPGAGTYNLTSFGNQDAFVAKFAAADGSLVYAKGIGGVNLDNGTDLAVDAAGNVYCTGTFFGSADFDPGAATVNLTGAGLFECFILKLDAAGNYVGAKTMGSLASDYGYGITIDAVGNIYVTGYINGEADFDAGAGNPNSIIVATNTIDVYIAKYGPLTPLPLTFIRFTGSVINNGTAVQLNWSTANETNNAYFEIERSQDGRNFEVIKTIPACSNCNTVQDYSTIDDNPFTGSNYYRLKQVDADQHFTYYKVIMVYVKEIPVVKLAPSITQNIVNLIIKSRQQNRIVLLQVSNTTGSIVNNRKIVLHNGEQKVPVSLAGQPSGLYFFSLYTETGETIFNTKAIKQ